MRYFIDTEFIESGPCKPIQLVSIGILAEDGRELYLHSSEYCVSDASEWVRVNVLPYVASIKPKTLSEIGTEILEFISHDSGKPEFWGYYADYDWVVFCQIFGTMVDLPKGWPMYCRDLKQWCDQLGNPRLPKVSGEHDALRDARWNCSIYSFLREIESGTVKGE